MTDYEVYDAGAASNDSRWMVLVEYSNKGQAKPPTVIEFPIRSTKSREEAVQAAEKVAYEFDPPDPWSPKARWVYRDGDGFLTIIEGATTSFHFSTRVVQYLGPG